MGQTPDEVLKDGMKRLRLSGEYTDMTIICGNDSYKLHKAIVCPRSRYFRAVFQNTMQESQTSQVDLSDHHPEAVKLLVDFFYHLDYTPSHTVPDQEDEAEPSGSNNKAMAGAAEETHGPAASLSKKDKKKDKRIEKLNAAHREFGNTLLTSVDESAASERGSLVHALQGETFLLDHCSVYSLAEYFQVNELKVLAASKFRSEAEKHWNHPDFFEAIQDVYRTSARNDRLLRDIVVDVLIRHKELLDRHEYQGVVSQLDLSFELLMAVHKAGRW